MQTQSKTQFLNPYTIVDEFGLALKMRVADFGSGSGHFTLSMARIVGKEGSVSAIDIRSSVLEVLKGYIRLEGLTQIKTIKGDLEREGGSTLKDSSQDIVLCSNILHQSEKPFNIIKEASRILKGGGRLIIIDWQRQSVFGPKQRISKEESSKLAKDAGFRLERELSPMASYYGLIFLK